MQWHITKSIWCYERYVYSSAALALLWSYLQLRFCMIRGQRYCIYLDIQKAFDNVPHCELLLKLQKIGISGKLWNWFRCYLSNCLQRVTISNSHSDSLPVLSGISQGSILGPMFTSMMCHRLISSLKCSYLLMMQNYVKVFLMLLTLYCYSVTYIIYKFGVLGIIYNLIFLSTFPSVINQKFNTTYPIDS